MPSAIQHSVNKKTRYLRFKHAHRKQLNTIDNRKIRQAISDSKQLVWVGLSDEQDEGNWLFTNNEQAADVVIPWGYGEPHNWNNIEHCAAAGLRGGNKVTLSDFGCLTSKFKVLCQYRSNEC